MEVVNSNSPADHPAAAGLLRAPWTAEQVAALNEYQSSGVFHEFTSENGNILIATPNGWVESEGGPVVQDWAHPFMADSDALRRCKELLRGSLPEIPNPEA